MPVGRFREDPRELDEQAREVYARQYPEGLHVVGSLLGLAVPIVLRTAVPTAPAILTSPLTSIFGLVVGGVGGYLLGHWYLRRQLRANRATQPGRSEGGE